MVTLHLKKNIKLRQKFSSPRQKLEPCSKYKNMFSSKQSHSFIDKINKWKEDFITPFYRKINLEIYYNINDIQKIKSQFDSAYQSLKTNWILKEKDTEGIINQFLEKYEALETHFEKHNAIFLKNEKEKYINLFNIEGKYLTDEQRDVAIVDEPKVLVLSGAGCGKTTAILGKIQYLVKRKGINPKDILVLSYTKASASELSERIKNLGIENLEAKTFHKLGKEIIEKQVGHRRVVDENSNPIRMVIQTIKEKINNKHIGYDKNIEGELWKEDIRNRFEFCFKKEMSWMDYLKKILKFESYYADVELFIEEFEDKDLYLEQEKLYDLETLKSCIEKHEKNKLTVKYEKVKSLAEAQIANFLFLNGIEYEYEKIYPFEIINETGKIISMRPDFYLPEYDLYIEHFGVTGTDGNFKASWLSSKDEKKYIQDIYFKRKTHQEHNTILLETYSEYSKQGILLEILAEKLKEQGVVFNPPSDEKIQQYLKALVAKKKLERLFRFLERYISLYKSNGLQKDDLNQLYTSLISNFPTKKKRTDMFFSLFKPLYLTYESFLKEVSYKIENTLYTGMIDYNDMILDSKKLIENGHIKKDYKYIIIDEFQDISQIRQQLINAIQKQTNAHIFCVGDDWQSIYGFSGSDVSLIYNLRDYKELYLTATHRNSQELINIAGDFIKKNPQQKKKSLVSPKRNKTPVYEVQYYENEADEYNQKSDKLNAIDIILQHILNVSTSNEVEIMLLGRNNKDKSFLCGDWIQAGEGKYSKSIKYINKNYPNVFIYFMTVHGAKGLEAENVIILNMEDDILGFPNKVINDYLLSPLLIQSDTYPLAEERRIFYVALTRGKEQCFLCVPSEKNKQSFFYKEIRDKVTLLGKTSEIMMREQEGETCPRCKSGQLIRKYNKTTKEAFLACSNYNQGEGCHYTREYNTIKH